MNHALLTGHTGLLLAAVFMVCLTAGRLSAADESAPAAGAEPASGDLVLGPYVNSVTDSGAKVLWVARAGVKGACQVSSEGAGGGPAPKVQLGTSTIGERTEILHTATVSGLAAAGRYRYVVTCGRDRAEGRFQTPPPPGARVPFKFVVYGDPQTYPDRHRQVVKGVMSELPFVFLAISGDLAEDGSKWSDMEEHFFDPARDLLRRTALWTVRGNHERDAVLYRQLFDLPNNEYYYSFDVGNLHYVVLDAYSEGGTRHRSGEQMTAMLRWLDKDLAATKADWVIVSYHDPTFNAGARGSTWGREDVLPVLEKHEVDIVICGHSHIYERCRPIGPTGRKPIIHITSGGGGGPSYNITNSPMIETCYSGLHFCVFNVNGNRLEMVARTPEGKVLDRMALVKTDGRYQKEIMDAALTTEQAVPLVKVFKLQVGELESFPRPGEPCQVVLPGEAFPEGWTVRITQAEECAWTVQPLSFAGGSGPVKVTATPPAGVKLAVTPWMGHFDPELKLAISLSRRERSYETGSVPVMMTPETVRKLVPDVPAVDVPPAARGVTVDGDLGEWKGVAGLHLPSTGAASGALRLAWSDKGLHGAVSVHDGDIRVNSREPAEGDGLELNLEMDCRHRFSIERTNPVLKLFVYPRPDQAGGAAGVDIDSSRYRQQQIGAAWRKTAAGYDMEFLIPAEVLAPARMTAGAKVAFHFVLRNGGKTVEEFADTSQMVSVSGRPFFWGTIRLGEK